MAELKISKEEISNLAILSDLDVKGEVEKLSNILSDTLDYIKTLNELDTSEVEETFQVTGLTNIYQDGSEVDSLTKEDALSNAKQEVNGLFSAKAVFNR
ncbi:aspartyl/glutamyl-tRNA amidotransferase subunit C [Patescibacteria group bacterium]|nr:aspartyl/glutamyl-tRNA amidotransferase subunit C [Patescibacteria group bacterium]